MSSATASRRITGAGVWGFSKKYAINIVLVLLIIFIGIKNRNFLSLANLRNVLIIASARMVIALGAGGILLTKGVDLSAGRTVGLAAVMAAGLAQRVDYSNRMYQNLPYLPLIVPIVAALVIGLIVGIFNGSVIAFLEVPPFITTLGSMTIVYGAASLYIDRPPLGAQPIGGLTDTFTRIGTGSIGGAQGFPYMILIAIVVMAVFWLMLNKTSLGKNIYAIGGNPDAALVSGVNVKKTLILVYCVAGVLYALGGIMLAARTGGATNNYGSGYELDAIAACVIGGVSTNGGVGTISGMATGVLIFEVLNNGLVVLGVSAYWQQIVKGIIIIIAVGLDIRKYLAKR